MYTADGKLKNCLFLPKPICSGLFTQGRAGGNPLIRNNAVKAKAALGGQLEGLFTNLDPAAIRNRSKDQGLADEENNKCGIPSERV